MSKRRAPFKKRYEDNKFGRFEVLERTGTPRYVTFENPWLRNKGRPLYHVVKSVKTKTSQRPNKLIFGFRNISQWRWRAESVTTVCGLRYLFDTPQIHDKINPSDRKCSVCFG